MNNLKLNMSTQCTELKPIFTAVLKMRPGIKKNGTQRKYSFKWRRTITMPSDKYLAWEQAAVFQLQQQLALSDLTAPIQGPLHVNYIFELSNKKHEPDTSNCIEGIQDALQKAGIIVNDKFIHSLTAKKLFTKRDVITVEVCKLD